MIPKTHYSHPLSKHSMLLITLLTTWSALVNGFPAVSQELNRASNKTPPKLASSALFYTFGDQEDSEERQGDHDTAVSNVQKGRFEKFSNLFGRKEEEEDYVHFLKKRHDRLHLQEEVMPTTTLSHQQQPAVDFKAWLFTPSSSTTTSKQEDAFYALSWAGHVGSKLYNPMMMTRGDTNTTLDVSSEAVPIVEKREGVTRGFKNAVVSTNHVFSRVVNALARNFVRLMQLEAMRMLKHVTLIGFAVFCISKRSFKDVFASLSLKAFSN